MLGRDWHREEESFPRINGTHGDHVGESVGDKVGDSEGDLDGDFVGFFVGDCDGDSVGLSVGLFVGEIVWRTTHHSNKVRSQWTVDKEVESTIERLTGLFVGGGVGGVHASKNLHEQGGATSPEHWALQHSCRSEYAGPSEVGAGEGMLMHLPCSLMYHLEAGKQTGGLEEMAY